MSTYSFTGNKVSFTYQRLLQISDGGDGNPTGIIYDGFGATVTIADENINYLYTTVNNLISNGIFGSTGPTGVQGLQGGIGLSITGNQGLMGATGIDATGVQGNTGIQGHQGLVGHQGPSGLTGVGTTGPQGYQGNTGLQGDVGSTGPQSNTGPQGFQGFGGGDTGPQGNTGFQGFDGPQGSTGASGTTGCAKSGYVSGDSFSGPVVASASVVFDTPYSSASYSVVVTAHAFNDDDYLYSVINKLSTGFTIRIDSPSTPPIGATAMWITNCFDGSGLFSSGAGGASGPTGDTGPPGATGSAGPTGASGPTGDTGPPGATGPSLSTAIYINQGSDPQVISGIELVDGKYDIGAGSTQYDMYRLNAEIVVSGGNNIYVNYIGSITIAGTTFKPFSNRGLVDAIDPAGFQNVQTALTTGALVYDEILSYPDPVDLILVNYDNTTSALTYDVFMIAGNTNNFSCKVYVDQLFYVDANDTITFTN